MEGGGFYTTHSDPQEAYGELGFRRLEEAAAAIGPSAAPAPFVIVVLILLACALLVYLRVPVYLRWQAEEAKGRIRRAARDGFLGGGAVALLSLLSPGEPGIQPGGLDRLIGIGVLIGLGIGNALAAYGVGSWIYRRRRD